jgi:hypothetical protein
MITALWHIVGWILISFDSRKDLILENLALRQQLLCVAFQTASPSAFDHAENVLGCSEKPLVPLAEAPNPGHTANRS